MELFIVHDGGRQTHLTSDHVLMRTVRHANAAGVVISDREAQTIAAQWQSPAEPLSTVLSTMGQVDRRMTRETFASEAEYNGADTDGKGALDALAAYIADKINRAESGYRPCACRDCFDIAIGVPGALCSECETAECTIGEGDECQRDDAYGTESRCPACGDPIDYCQGHGASGDPVGARTLELHDQGVHSRCITDAGVCD